MAGGSGMASGTSFVSPVRVFQTHAAMAEKALETSESASCTQRAWSLKGRRSAPGG